MCVTVVSSWGEGLLGSRWVPSPRWRGVGVGHSTVFESIISLLSLMCFGSDDGNFRLI